MVNRKGKQNQLCMGKNKEAKNTYNLYLDVF